MLSQLAAQLGGGPSARERILVADPLDLRLRVEEVWREANIWQLPGDEAGPAGKARRWLFREGEFAAVDVPEGAPWHHWIYSFAIENTRASQILSRVAQSFRVGEALGAPSIATIRWLDATESLLGGELISAPQAGTAARRDPEGVRRNAYWRMFGMDLGHGTQSNTQYSYEKAAASNASFVPLFEELLAELQRASAGTNSPSHAIAPDDARIFGLIDQLRSMLNSRRGNGLLSRDELLAATTMGWIELSLGSNTPVVVDLRAEADNAADRLRLVGERVGLAPHSRSKYFLAMAPDLSIVLQAIEAGWVTDSSKCWLLYRDVPPAGEVLAPPVVPLGGRMKSITKAWTAASGRQFA